MEASQLLFPLISSRVTLYVEALDWLQFTFTGDRNGAYITPGLTEVTFHILEDGVPLFTPTLQQLCTLYPRVYAQGSTSTLESGPGGPEYRQKRPHEVRKGVPRC